MTAKVIDGRAIAATIKNKVKKQVADRKNKGLTIPGLEVILVGDNPASASYVKVKENACREAGIRSHCHRLPNDVSIASLTELIDQCNADSATHGILLQLPLPETLQPLNIP